MVFCYQAAALEEKLNGGALPATLMATVRRGVADRQKRPFDLATWAKVDNKSHDAGGLWRDRAFAVEEKVFRSLKLDPDKEFITTALGPLVNQAREMMPKPMRRDAKTSEIEVLIGDLTAPGSGFTQLGRTKLEGQRFVIEA